MLTKVKLGIIVDLANDIRTLLSYRCNTTCAFKLLEKTKPIHEKLNHYNKVKDELFQRLGEPVPGSQNPNEVRIKEENKKEFWKSMEELSNIDVELDTPIISYDEVFNGSITDEISPLVILRLEPLIYNIDNDKSVKEVKRNGKSK